MENLTPSMLDSMAKVARLPQVYPSYLIAMVKRCIIASDQEQVIQSIGPIDRIGDGRYAMTATDFNGAEYRISVEPIGRIEV